MSLFAMPPGKAPNQFVRAAANGPALPGVDIPKKVRYAASLMRAGAVLGAISLLYRPFTTSPVTAQQIINNTNLSRGAQHAGLAVVSVVFAPSPPAFGCG
jgi:hypothetical protein